MKHYLSNEITVPDERVPVFLIGSGGTGSQMLNGLARLHTTLIVLGHPGIDVTVFDPDRVTESNLGRQLFSPSDIGLHKANVLVTRINQFYGLDWKAVPSRFDETIEFMPSLLISAVDTVKSRLTILKWFEWWYHRSHDRRVCYWMDLGNTRNTGQVILGTLGKPVTQPPSENVIGKLPCITDLYNLKKVKEKDQGPSCSLAAALKQQDLMINQMVATCALELLWKAFRHGYIETHGAFIDLAALKVAPLPVNPATWQRMKN